MGAKLWHLDHALQDAYEALERAATLAAEISGASPGRAADPEYDIPGEEPDEGWPLMNRLASALDGLAISLQLLRKEEELAKAIEGEQAADDEDEARADAASY